MMPAGNRGAEVARRGIRGGPGLPSLVTMSEHPLAGAATVLAQWPRVVARLLHEHVPGPDGRCRGCRSQVRTAPRWPCRLTLLARRAVEQDPDR
jgi:hypothetical protein